VKKIADARQGGLEAHGPAVVLGKGWGPIGMYAVKKSGADKKPDAVVFAMRVKGDDVVRFIVSGQSVHLPKLKEVANQLQRIPAPMPNGSFLYGPKPHQSTRADQMRALLVDQTGGGTVAQGHSDWYISRFFKLTASMLPTLVPRVRQANPGRCSVFLCVLRFAGDAHHNEEPLPDVVPEELRAEEDRSRATLATVLEAELTAQIPPPPPPPPLPPPPPADDNAAAGKHLVEDEEEDENGVPADSYVLFEAAESMDPGLDDEEPPEVPFPAAPSFPTSATAALLSNLFVTIGRYYFTSFKGNEATKGGKYNEPRMLAVLSHMPGVQEVYACGLFDSIKIAYCVASPDCLLWITKASGDVVPAVGEFKTTDMSGTTPTPGYGVLEVEAGSALYYAHVPDRFRAQLIMQAFVLGFNHSVLLISTSTAIVARVLIEYSDEQMDSLEEFLKLPQFAILFGWFMRGCTQDRTAAEVIATIPPECKGSTRKLIASHVPRCLALFKYRRDVARHILPTHVFRFSLIEAYDKAKPWIDIASQVVKQLIGSSATKPKFGAKLVQHVLAFMMYQAARASRVFRQLSHISRTGAEMPSTLPAFRTVMNKLQGRYVDQVDAALMSLLSKGVVFGDQPNGLPSPPLPLGSAAAASEQLIRAVYPERVRLLITGSESGIVPDIRLLHGFPLSLSAVSTTTPTKTTLQDKYLRRTPGLVTIFEGRPKERARLNTKRLWFYDEESGGQLRLAWWLLHVQTKSGRVKRESVRIWCVRCLKSRTAESCALCGVGLCSECFSLFHTEAHLPFGLSGSADDSALDEGTTPASASLSTLASAASHIASAASATSTTTTTTGSIPFNLDM